MSKDKASKIAILILAAGSSSRMGQPKQLLPWQDTTLLGHIIGTASKVSNTVLVILGSYADKIRHEVPDSISYIINEFWEEGMGGSIAAGVKELEKSTNPDAILVLLADQPFIDEAYIRKMITKYLSFQDKIIATSYHGRAGVPTLFPSQYFEMLKTLNGDSGAKPLMKHYSEKVEMLNPQGKAVDIDTLKAYNVFKKASKD